MYVKLDDNLIIKKLKAVESKSIAIHPFHKKLVIKQKKKLQSKTISKISFNF